MGVWPRFFGPENDGRFERIAPFALDLGARSVSDSLVREFGSKKSRIRGAKCEFVGRKIVAQFRPIFRSKMSDFGTI